MQVRWTPTAVGDLTQICDSIDQHDSGASARRVALAIYQEVNSLARFASWPLGAQTNDA
jgi:plasmid stabilization system protein ParE